MPVRDDVAEQAQASVDRAVRCGLAGAIVIDGAGEVLARRDVSDDDAQALSVYVSNLRGDDLARRLFDGEHIEMTLDDRPVCVGVASTFLFLGAIGTVGEAGDSLEAVATRLRGFRADLEAMTTPLTATLSTMSTSRPPPTSGSGGTPSGSGPAHLPAGLARGPRAKA